MSARGAAPELRIGGTRLSAHPLALLVPLAMLKLGVPAEARALPLALLAHEGAHLAAARLAGVAVNRLTLTPFGGALELGNPYALGSGRLLAVAAAGPLGSLLAILAASALAQLGALPAGDFIVHARVNLVLMLFNLLPALPLDGGRMLFALLSPRLGRERAARLGLAAGRAVAAGLAAMALAGWRLSGRLNLSPLMAAVFLLAAAPGELRALTDTRVQSLLNALRPVSGPVPARLYAVGANCPARKALRAANPESAALYAVYEGGRFLGFTDERRLLEALASGGDARPGAQLFFPPPQGSRMSQSPTARAHFG